MQALREKWVQLKKTPTQTKPNKKYLKQKKKSQKNPQQTKPKKPPNQTLKIP